MTTTTNQATDREIEMRCKAFSVNRSAQVERIMVSADGTVRVYDSVAGHYTRCHVLGSSAQRRARKLASQ